MFMTTLAFADHDVHAHTTTFAQSALGRSEITMVQLNDSLWRLTRPDGEVFGYIESFIEPRGLRFRAKRLNILRQRFVVLGEFWSMKDAIDSLGAR